MDRATRKSRSGIFGQFLKGVPLDDSIVLRFVGGEALDEEHFDTAQWKPDLETIKKCYHLGGSLDTSLLYSQVPSQDTMPRELAEKISTEATHFPLFLVAAAQDRLLCAPVQN
jgi:hypothetical protein